MALTALPLTDVWPAAWEHDPALDNERETFQHDYKLACERLDWSSITKPGERPTLFYFRPLAGSSARALLDAGHQQHTMLALAFRMALVRVENFDACPKLNRKLDPAQPQLGPLVDDKVIEFLDQLPVAIGKPYGHIVSTLGLLVLQRSMGLQEGND